MNREILFRAKRIYNGEWVEGHLCKNRFYWLIRKYDSNGFLYNDIEIIPETVGQYTCLTDKNGVKIFEGDVIECKLEYKDVHLPHRGVVVYSDDLACYCTRNESGDTPLLNLLINTISVIGNINGQGE